MSTTTDPTSPTEDPAGSKPQVDEAARSRASGLRTIRKVVPYLWPADQAWVKYRVVLALLALVIAKVVAVGTPMFYSAAVDSMSEDAGEGMPLAIGAVGLTVAYGMARLLTVGFQQLRDVIFAAIG